jgi:hypothetical protein
VLLVLRVGLAAAVAVGPLDLEALFLVVELLEGEQNALHRLGEFGLTMP